MRENRFFLKLELDKRHIAMAGLSNESLNLFNLNYDGKHLCALGNNKTEILPRLLVGDRSGLFSCNVFSRELFIVGKINAPLPDISTQYRFYQCQNNQLLLAKMFS